jgi:hypothetical protein
MAATCRHAPGRPFGRQKQYISENYEHNEHLTRAGDGGFFPESVLWEKNVCICPCGSVAKKLNSHSFCVKPSLADGYGYAYKYFPKKS